MCVGVGLVIVAVIVAGVAEMLDVGIRLEWG